MSRFHTTVAGWAAAAMACAALAETYHVPGDFADIQPALDAAEAGDTIMVGPGTWPGPLIFPTSCAVIATDGPTVTIIDGSQTSDSLVTIKHRNENTLLQGFTILNADGGTPVGQDETIIVGGGVRIVAGAPVIDGCVFENNHSGYGGAVHCAGSEATISNCTFHGNSASANGGALLIINGAVPVSNCSFTENHATLDGGALHVVNGAHTLTACEIVNNTSIDGAGLSWHGEEDGSSLPIIGCTITDNAALNVGGGVRGVAGRPPVAFYDSTVCDNTPDEFDSPWLDEGGNTLCICPADINGNGLVDINDVLVVVAQWDTDGPQGDINRDGVVNVLDLLITIDLFGPCVFG